MPDPKLDRARPDRRDGKQDELARAAYESYARNALVQLRRVREGSQIEEDHMRNRQMVVRWLIANTKAVEVRQPRRQDLLRRDRRRRPSARASARCSRRSSGSSRTGDYAAAKALFETHGIHFDPSSATRSSPGSRRSTCRRTPRSSCPGSSRSRTTTATITDVTISYPMDLTTQMLEFARFGQ